MHATRVVTTVLFSVFAAAAYADVDLSGSWSIAFGGFLPTTFTVQFSQSGTSLDTGSGAFPAGCAGTIDPATGSFSLACSPHPAGVLPGGFPYVPSPAPTIDGTSADGLTMDGTFVDWFIKTTPPTDPEHFPWFPNGGSFHGVSRFCGNGLLDAGEECDDGNALAGDGCDASCHIEQCFTCAGEPSVCTPTVGGGCDDANPCTVGDACVSPGVCAGSVLPDGAACDDGRSCTTGETCTGGTCGGGTDICGPCLACGLNGSCVPHIQTTCHRIAKFLGSSLVGRATIDGARDSLTWKWPAGPQLSPVDFGDPLGADAYTLCIFSRDPTDELLFRATAPAGGTCRSKPCWRTRVNGGFSYTNRDATPDGLTTIDLKPGAEGRSSVTVKGKGTALAGRPFPLPLPPLPLPLEVQLQRDGGQCFAGTLSTGVSTPSGAFKARGN